MSATVVYYFPSTPKARFGIGGGLGIYSSSGEAKVYDSTTLTEETESRPGGAAS